MIFGAKIHFFFLEQERRDHELALRLARESKSGVDDLVTSTTPPRSLNENQVSPGATPVAQKSKAKYDLSNWKYAELRDTINTSCDIGKSFLARKFKYFKTSFLPQKFKASKYLLREKSNQKFKRENSNF